MRNGITVLCFMLAGIYILFSAFIFTNIDQNRKQDAKLNSIIKEQVANRKWQRDIKNIVCGQCHHPNVPDGWGRHGEKVKLIRNDHSVEIREEATKENCVCRQCHYGGGR